MLKQAECRGQGAVETAAKGRAAEVAATVSNENIAELERVLLILTDEGAEIHHHPDLDRAVLYVSLGGSAQRRAGVTSRSIAKTLTGLGWTRQIPTIGQLLMRDQITPAGREAYERIARGNVIAAAHQVEPEIAQSPVSSRAALRAELEKLPEDERLDYCLDLLDQFIGEDRTVYNDWLALGVHLTDGELRFVGRLAADRGEAVRREVLQFVCSANPGADLVGGETVRKLAYSVRAKLRDAGLPVEIVTKYGAGYAITAPGDFNIPGEEGST